MSRKRLPALAAFLRLLVSSGSAQCEGDNFGATFAGKRGEIPSDVARSLAARGLVVINPGGLVPTSEARAWIVRHLAAEDGFATQHRLLRLGAGGTLINDAESPLRRLAVRDARSGVPFLKPHLVMAGERVRELVERGRLLPKVTLAYAPDRSAGRARQSRGEGAEITDMAIDARRQLADLRQRMSSDCAGIVIDVCGMLKGLQQVETERRLPPRSGKWLLRAGLEQAAGVFGLTEAATGHEKGRPRQWRNAPRPRLEP
jgi:hypothetical protein